MHTKWATKKSTGVNIVLYDVILCTINNIFFFISQVIGWFEIKSDTKIYIV